MMLSVVHCPGTLRFVLTLLRTVMLLGCCFFLLPGCARQTTPPANSVTTTPGEPNRTGLNPPTAADRALMDETMVRTGEVKPNKLGLERINTERAKHGLPPLQIQPAPDGQEVVPAPKP